MAMMSALSSAVTGLKSQQTALDVIANNISNVNTTGYKSQRVSFGDLLSQTLSSASSGTATKGSKNAVQLGLGVSVAGTSTNMTAGSTSSTGIASDVAIGGAGFLIVQGDTVGSYKYTRAGNLSIDDDGNVNVNGNKICGWEKYTIDADGKYVYNTDATAEPINIFNDTTNGNKKVIAAKESTSVDFTSGVLNSTATVATGATALKSIGSTSSLTFDQTTSSIKLYDTQGNEYDASIKWKKCYTDGTTTSWYYEVSANNNATISPTSGYVAFDANGKMVSSATTTSGSTVSFDTTPTFTVTPPSSAGTAAFPVKLNLSDITTTASSSTTTVTGTSDGYQSGTLSSWSIASDGTITGIYSNNQTQSLGKIALAVFSNSEGLTKDGDNLYTASASSGDATVVAAGAGGSGSLSSGTLELSNVDLAEQFSDMMISQRAYQANSKVITTADTMLQSLINMIS